MLGTNFHSYKLVLAMESYSFLVFKKLRIQFLQTQI